MESVFLSILNKHDFSGERAGTCARIFTQNSLEGVYIRRVNRFPRFIRYIKEGYVLPENKPETANSSGAVEQWDGRLGTGMNNVLDATHRSMELAQNHGIGVSSRENHLIITTFLKYTPLLV
jgi:3-dehydro-L-gulonate 2-dehydrogenase